MDFVQRRLLHKFGYEGFTSCFCHWIHWLSDRSEKEQDKIGASDRPGRNSYWKNCWFCGWWSGKKLSLIHISLRDQGYYFCLTIDIDKASKTIIYDQDNEMISKDSFIQKFS